MLLQLSGMLFPSVTAGMPPTLASSRSLLKCHLLSNSAPIQKSPLIFLFTSHTWHTDLFLCLLSVSSHPTLVYFWVCLITTIPPEFIAGGTITGALTTFWGVNAP